MRVNAAYPYRLSIPVVQVVLDDIEAVDPQVLQSKCTRGHAGILQGAGE